MQALVASLTAAVLFIHTVFGCCWHHAHFSAAVVAKPVHCCHHHKHESDSKQQEKPCKCNVECEGTCSYVVPGRVTVEAPQWITIDLVAVLPTLAGRQIEAASSWEALSSLPNWVLPLRTHLMHQVMLN
jgi:hypothetical protein